MDCHMPEMDGFEATKQLRARERSGAAKRIPIVALTANAMAQDREECLNAGMDDHLSKPFSSQTLQGMLERWMPARSGAALDRSRLEQLGEVLTNGKPELLARVIDLYLLESSKIVQRLLHAAQAGDAAELASAAHSLRSCSANVGAQAVSDQCAAIEAAARRADLEQARSIVASLHAEYGRVRTALAAQTEATTRAAA
jgi:DNA-binding response OmpR family regulator